MLEKDLGAPVDASEPPRHPGRAYNAADAGKYLAERMGLPKPFDAQAMWRYGRQHEIPTLRIGRRVFFTTDALDRFVESGGSPANPK
jgi:hypothetical protein